jgi:hypothetical protein
MGQNLISNVGLASEHRFYRRRQVVFQPKLSHVSQRSCFHACLDELFCRMHCHEYKLCCGTQFPELVQSVNPVQNRHADISHDDVRMEPADFRHQSCTIRCRPNYIKIGRQESDLRLEQIWVVVSQQNTWKSQTSPATSVDAYSVQLQTGQVHMVR